MKRKCNRCNALAVWVYVPGSDDRYYCDEHVPRGCSCMIDDDENYLTDDSGRPVPCVEYDYSKKGFRVES